MQQLMVQLLSILATLHSAAKILSSEYACDLGYIFGLGELRASDKSGKYLSMILSSIRSLQLLSTVHLSLNELTMAAPQILIVAAVGFNPNNHIYPAQCEDGGACVCGQWYFYSATCGGVYQVLSKPCGINRTRRGVNTAYCPKTSTRVLYGAVRINAHCPAVPTATHPHP
jgi:hypothetical protein